MGIYNNILVILIGPNHLGCVLGHDNVWALCIIGHGNVWAQYIWGQCLIPSSMKGYCSKGCFRTPKTGNLGYPMILGPLMMMSQ